MSAVEFSWQSTPQLWMATFDDYDGAPDSYCPIGIGTTQEDATRNLFEHDEGRHERRMQTPAEVALVAHCGERRKA